MAIHFSGEFATPRTPEEVFEFLSDPNKFAPLLPDFQSMTMHDETHFTVKVKVGVGNIRGAAEIKMELAETVKPLRAQYKGQGSAVGSQVTVSAGFDLHPNGDSTRVLWQGETSVFGKLASMAGGMLEPLGRKNIQKLIDGLQQALAEPVAKESQNPRDSSRANATQVEASSSSQPNTQSIATEASVEAPGFSPANSETSDKEASTPTQETHGDHTA